MRIINCIVLFFIAVQCLQAQPVTMELDPSAAHDSISRFIYGEFAEHLGRDIYDGFWVSDSLQVPKKGRIRLDVTEALRRIRVPLLRWPGGCFADQYHWSDGIGPRADRPARINNNWGKVTEDNSFGTHEFLELCSLIGCEPYISGNVGSGTPQEMSNWIEYLNFDRETTLTRMRKLNGHPAPWNVSFWGVGNESWGCGGLMEPEYYADQYKRYATYCQDYDGRPLKKIVSGASEANYRWTEVCMQKIPASLMWGIAIHYYALAGTWEKKLPATGFNEEQYFNALKRSLAIEPIIMKHLAVMDKYDPLKKVALAVDEWGTWTAPEPGTNPDFLFQQNSVRDALIAASTLNIFNNHCDRIKMACLAQTVNVLQALILTDKEKMLLTPTYHVFEMYKDHQDAVRIPVRFSSPEYRFGNDSVPAVNVSASRDSLGAVHITLVNLHATRSIPVSMPADGLPGKSLEAKILTSTAYTDINTFDDKDKVTLHAFTAVKRRKAALQLELPPFSIVELTLK